MTRFLMSLDEAVELVLFAFEHGNQGDLFVNKAPAGTIGDLAQAMRELCKANNEVRVIGTRHGEKLYETLCTREEMMKAEDMGEFYRIPADNRNLNYNHILGVDGCSLQLWVGLSVLNDFLVIRQQNLLIFQRN